MSVLDLTPTRADRPPGPGTVLARTCHAEWSRLWTVRSTWWFALATAVIVLGTGTLLGLDVQGDPPSMQPDGTAWLGATITATFGLYGLLALGVVAATSDHGTGGIVPALQATPRRGILLAARTAVIVAFSAVFGSVLVAGSSAVVYAFAPEMGLPLDTGLEVLADVAFVYATCLLLAVGTGLLARNTAGTLVAVLAATLVLPLMLGALPFEWARSLAEVLPGNAAMRLLAGEAPVPMTEVAAYWMLAGWAAVAMAAGAARLLRSDAHR